jgi:dihydroflavonol-4-reductase
MRLSPFRSLNSLLRSISDPSFDNTSHVLIAPKWNGIQVIFVTGASGLLGNCVVRELLARNIPVRALWRPGTPRRAIEGLDIQIIQGTLENGDALTRAVQGCQAVIHCAAMIHLGWTQLEESRQVNVEGTRRIVEACLVNAAKLIHVSTVDTLPAARSIEDPIDELCESGVPKIPCSYVVSKREAEDVVRCAMDQQQLNAVIVNPGFMLGPYDWKPSSGRVMLGVSRALIPFATRGGCSLCDARDVASAIVNAVVQGQSGQSYILAGENITYRQLWANILETVGRPRRVFWPYRAITVAGWFFDAANRLLPIRERSVNGAAIALGQLNNFYSSAKAARELDYRCRPSTETLGDTWRWLSEHFPS